MTTQPLCIEVQRADGTVLFRINVTEQEPQGMRSELQPQSLSPTDGEGQQPQRKAPTSAAPKTHGRRDGKGEPESMTDAQKRYIFRLLADQKIEGDKATQHLKNLLNVQSLREITKFDASKLIERLLETVKGDGDNGTPF